MDPKLTAEQAERHEELVVDVAVRLRAWRNVARGAIVRAHDTRSTFITVALASGRSETRVAGRAGQHRSFVVSQRYRQAAGRLQSWALAS
ncbi:hypothetical protein [Sorangium sp. So ce542]|uniref:hypothetical protein n=1 Tax=Sorangium sp. So ce542 TaxID=3133316 RepID=UPI003F5E0A61